MDEATGQPSTTEANQSRKRRRKEGETASEVESAVVAEESPAKKVLECHVYALTPQGTGVALHFFWSCTYLFQPKKWKNKQRVLVFCARGITYRLVVFTIS